MTMIAVPFHLAVRPAFHLAAIRGTWLPRLNPLGARIKALIAHVLIIHAGRDPRTSPYAMRCLVTGFGAVQLGALPGDILNRSIQLHAKKGASITACPPKSWSTQTRGSRSDVREAARRLSVSRRTVQSALMFGNQNQIEVVGINAE